MLSALSIWLRRLWADRQANVAVITALCALPLLGMVGLSIDYGLLLMNKTKLDAAADAAAVAAITTAQAAIQGGSTTLIAKAAGEAQGRLAFAANAGSIAFSQNGTPTPTVTVTPSTTQSVTTLSSTVTYGTQMATNFGRLVGVTQFNINGKSGSSLALPTYKNYYILLDISNSMGIGATPTDMANLYARTQTYGNGGDNYPGCVFACHVVSSGRTYSNEQLARMSPTITLRIDSAISAIRSMITSAQTSSNSSRIQIGLYTMDEVHLSTSTIQQPTVQTVMSLSNNWSALSTAAAGIDLGNNDGSVGYGDSDFTSSLSEFASTILPTAGDGSTASSPLNYVFVITDGLKDTYGACSYGHCTAALDPAGCQPIKTKGASVGVIYTTYLPLYAGNNSANGFDVNYIAFAQSNVPNIPTQLQSCASTPTSSFYFEATAGADITTGIQKLFAGTDTPARITQ